MSFFSKDKISIKEVANSLADFAFNSISHESLAPFEKLLEDTNKNSDIRSEQKMEMLILSMLATTRAVEKLLKNFMCSTGRNKYKKCHGK